jgi:hypothetical protein
MAHRDEGYWGKDVEKLFDYGNGRLNLRSIKLIADGMSNFLYYLGLFQRHVDQVHWGVGELRCTNRIRITPRQLASGAVPLETLQSDIPKYIADGWQVVCILPQNTRRTRPTHPPLT